jgi:hypothetical protein
MRIFEIFDDNEQQDETSAQVDPSTIPGGAPATSAPGPEPQQGQLPGASGAAPDAGFNDGFSDDPMGDEEPLDQDDVQFARSHEYLTSGHEDAAKDALELLGMDTERLKDELTQTKREMAKIEMEVDAGLYDDPDYKRLGGRAKFIADLISKK